MTDTNVSQLVINKLTQEQYKAAKEAGQIVETELYMITDGEDEGANITVDTHVTQGSENPVSGGAVYEAIQTVESAIPTAPEDIDAAKASHSHAIESITSLDNFANTLAPHGVIPVISATSQDGLSYAATLDGLTEYYDGLIICVTANIASAGASKLNINGLGDVNICAYKLGDYNTTGDFALIYDYLIFRETYPALLFYHGGVFLNLMFSRTSLDKHSGFFGGEVRANSAYQTPANRLLRNSTLVTTDTNPSYNGEICWTYG